ncbi:MAG: hypothetical protein ACOC4K_04075 [Verrucomicrobiota bacterium]
MGYEFSLGDDEVLQDTDELRLWISANKGFDRLHLGLAATSVWPPITESPTTIATASLEPPT